MSWSGLIPSLAAPEKLLAPIAVAAVLYLGPLVETLMEDGIRGILDLGSHAVKVLSAGDLVFIRNCIVVGFAAPFDSTARDKLLIAT